MGFWVFSPESDSVCFLCKNNLHLNKQTIINMIRADFVHRPSALEMKVKILSGCENTRVTDKTHGPLVLSIDFILEFFEKHSFYIYRSDERKIFNTYWWYREIDRSKFALSEPGWYRPWETNVTSFSHHFHWQKVGCIESVIIFINYIIWHSQLGNLNAILQVQTIEQVWLHLICWLHNTLEDTG